MESEINVSESNFNGELTEIVSLCTELGNCHKKVRALGFLSCSKGYRHEFYTSVRDSTGGERETLSLTELLSNVRDNSGKEAHRNECRISREDRKRLSLQICSSVLQLYETSWITGEWNGDEIVFKCRDRIAHSSSLRHPYLRGRFAPDAGIPKDTQAILFQLGMLLLELCLGERLTGPCPGSEATELNWENAYHRWVRNAKNEEGPEIAEAIRKCLEFDFATECRTLQSEELRKALFNEVIHPLMDALNSFRME